MISSSKILYQGIPRLEVMNYTNDNFKNIDLYGNNFKDLPHLNHIILTFIKWKNYWIKRLYVFSCY